MRIALIILSILALIFIGSISWSLVSQDGWKVRVPGLSSDIQTPEIIENPDNITLETWKNQIKTDEKLERLTTMVEDLAKKNGTYTPESTINLPMSQSGNTDANPVRASGKLLSLLMPTVTPVLTRNSGIF
jgi:hypothetical protein